MSDPIFFQRARAPTIAEVAEWTGARIVGPSDASGVILGVAPLEDAGPTDLAFLDNPKYLAALATTRAIACFVKNRHAAEVPGGTVALVTEQPYRSFAVVLAKLYPQALRPQSLFDGAGISPSAVVHPLSRLEPGVTVDPGAVIGPRAEIGEGSIVAANAVIGPDVRIGRDCMVGANATVQHALIGNRVILHPGVKIGQDGFGFAMGPRGHLKIPQIGRVIIQDDVEIGAGTAVDRGANRDTIVGEGTKIDNLVQIGHNVVIGRHCVIVAQVGISGSTTLGDFVAIGGQAGLSGHLTIGAGAQIGAASGLMNDVPAGERWAGQSPAQPQRAFFREVAMIRKMVRRDDGSGK